ncbi:Serine protease 29 [Halotydeus destructor]|nr:Serine protease 29 [Halotydeus destructor]
MANIALDHKVVAILLSLPCLMALVSAHTIAPNPGISGVNGSTGSGPLGHRDGPNNVLSYPSCRARDERMGQCVPPEACLLKGNQVDSCDLKDCPRNRDTSLEGYRVCCPASPLDQVSPPPNDPICGTKGSGSRIVNGEVTQPYEYPWQAGLVFGPGSRGISCGATIIHKRFAITAAHCFESHEADPQDHFLLVGAYDAAKDGEVVALSKIIIHKNYDYVRKSRYNDIVLLKLAKDVVFSYDMVVTGWGQTGETGPESNLLRKATVPILCNGVCTRAYCKLSDAGYAYPKGMLDTQFCAGGNGRDSCSGDSGGPMVWLNSDDGKYYLFGAVSFGKGCNERGYPGVYTRISSFLAWIGARMKENS